MNLITTQPSFGDVAGGSSSTAVAVPRPIGTLPVSLPKSAPTVRDISVNSNTDTPFNQTKDQTQQADSRGKLLQIVGCAALIWLALAWLDAQKGR